MMKPTSMIALQIGDDGDLAQAREAAKLLARTGNREAQEFLARSRGQKNLPDLPTALNR
jgi:hypothetical protein